MPFQIILHSLRGACGSSCCRQAGSWIWALIPHFSRDIDYVSNDFLCFPMISAQDLKVTPCHRQCFNLRPTGPSPSSFWGANHCDWPDPQDRGGLPMLVRHILRFFFFRSPFGSAGSKKDLAKQEGWRRCVCDFKWFEDGNRFSGIQEFGSPNPPRQIHGPTCTRGPVLRKEGGNEVLLVRQAFIKLKWAEAQFKTQNLHILASSDTSCAQAGGIFGGSSQGVCEKMFAILCAFWFPRSFEWSLQADGQMHQKRRNNILRHICYK